MKRFITIVFSFLIMLFGGMTISSNFALADEEGGVFEINSAEQYVEVLSNDDAYLENAKIILKNDILDLQSQDLSRVYSKNRVFKGIFDGNGYTISNVTVGGYGGYFGLIPYAENATIQNLRIQQNVTFDFGDENYQDVFAGILVGYGKNVIISNCELDGEIDTDVQNNMAQSDTTSYTVTVPVNSNVYIGALAGKLSGTVISSTQCSSRVYDCINYYNFSLEMAKKGNVYAGGLVGELENASFERVINFGNLSLRGITLSDNNSFQYLGGLAGSVAGSKATIKNSLSGSSITLSNVASLNKLYRGGLIGGNPYGTASAKNFNYDYYKDNTLVPSGDTFLTTSEKLCLKDFTNHEFLSDQTNFDGAVEPWDFNKTWSLNFHLQNFQLFTYVLNNVIDTRGVFAKAYFIYNGQTSEEVNGEQDTGNVEIQAKFNGVVTICLEMKEEYKDWYILRESGVHLNTNSSVSNEITLSEPESGHYNITFNASLLTSGADYKGYYSFTAEAVIYVCSISVSQAAITNTQGTYKIDAGNPTTVENSVRFSYDKRSAKVVAEGSGHFTFDHWEILYKDLQGDFSEENKYEKNIETSELTINYGEVPFDKEFKCVAYFTDDKAIKVSFGDVGAGTGIKSIKFGGKDYDGNTVKEILVSPNNSSIPLEVVTNKGYKINVDEFIKDIAELYGDNSSDYTLSEDPRVDEETGETTYNFQLNMRFISVDSLENNSLKLSFVLTQEGGGSGKTLLWVYITIPVVVVIVAGVVLFIILRRRRMASDDSGGGSTKQKESKPKKESYKNYY